MMVLVGQFDSPFVRRVAATLHHYEMPFDRHVLSVFGDRDEVMRLNPLGKVPALILEGGETIVDSAMILDFLDETVGPERSLTPPRGEARRRVLRLATVAMGVSERAVALRVETVRRPAHLQNPDFVNRFHEQIRAGLDWLEAECRAPWFSGEALSQADISATAALTHLRRKITEYKDLTSWPNLLRLSDAGEALPAFKAAPFVEG